MGRQIAAILGRRHAAAQSEIAMEVIFVFILPLILNIATLVFLRTCCERSSGKPVPRMLCYGLVVLAFIPIGSWIMFLILIVSIINNIADDDLNLKENRFNKFWFKS